MHSAIVKVAIFICRKRLLRRALRTGTFKSSDITNGVAKCDEVLALATDPVRHSLRLSMLKPVQGGPVAAPQLTAIFFRTRTHKKSVLFARLHFAPVLNAATWRHFTVPLWTKQTVWRHLTDPL